MVFFVKIVNWFYNFTLSGIDPIEFLQIQSFKNYVPTGNYVSSTSPIHLTHFSLSFTEL